MNRKKILIIDDDEAAVFGYTNYLSQEGYAITSAETLEDGLRSLSADRFDAVIFDVRLPDGNSLDAIPGVRAANPALRIFVISGLTDAATSQRAIGCGVDKFLVKPLSMSELCRTIAASLEEQSPDR